MVADSFLVLAAVIVSDALAEMVCMLLLIGVVLQVAVVEGE